MYMLNRLIHSLGVILGTITLVFFILFWLPGDPAEIVAGENASQETIHAIQEQLGTNRPILQQYASYLGKLLTGDLGTSFITNTPVLDRLLEQMVPTLELALLAALVALLAGIALGSLSAICHKSLLDSGIQWTALVLASMPSFWLGTLLILLFSVRLQWLPSVGNTGFSSQILPALALGLIASGTLIRLVRSSMLDTLNEPYVLTLKAKGSGLLNIYLKHALKNSLLPVVTLFGVLLGTLLSGTVVIEILFARQGLGRTVIEAVGQKDIPVIQGAVLLIASLYVLINLLVDLSYRCIDPRTQQDTQHH
ncbi:ABC transporter permease [Pseudomonas sp. zfem002]|uniref:ABC transporter permease n=1 Tax=Pseudomonas sp. zfem002 TaxID=3078197 RepID=UPI002928119D|nr:ABC transporter permease [Pseudomonas sp. zfem002]MDU9392893.1 ABC transporter permease [Pseudomonas sp. zfem002]